MYLAVIFVLFSFVFLTILNQFNNERLSYFCRKYLFGIVPQWTFFAPKPGMNDFRVSYRCFLDDVADSTKLCPVFENYFDRPDYAFFWNPQKRLKKAVFDMCIELATIITHNQKKASTIRLELSLPYILILSYVSNLPEVKLYSKIQFLISISSYKEHAEKLQVMYISDIHTLS